MVLSILSYYHISHNIMPIKALNSQKACVITINKEQLLSKKH